MINDVEHLFIRLLPSFISFLEKCLFKSFAHFWIRLLGFLLLTCRSSLYPLDINPLSDYDFQIFSPNSMFSFYSVDCFLCCTEVLKYYIFTIVYFFLLLPMLLASYQEIIYQIQSIMFDIVFFSKNFIASGLTFRSLIHFELIFVYGIRWGFKLHSFACGYSVFPAAFIEETNLFPLWCLGTHISDNLTIYVRVYFLFL